MNLVAMTGGKGEANSALHQVLPGDIAQDQMFIPWLQRLVDPQKQKLESKSQHDPESRLEFLGGPFRA